MPKQTDDTRLVTILLIIVGAFVIVPMFFMGFGMMGYQSMMGGMWGDRSIPGWLFVVRIVMQLLFLAAIIGGGYLTYRTVAGRENGSDQALEELQLAYARGDLTDDEYEQRREALKRDTKSK